MRNKLLCCTSAVVLSVVGTAYCTNELAGGDTTYPPTLESIHEPEAGSTSTETASLPARSDEPLPALAEKPESQPAIFGGYFKGVSESHLDGSIPMSLFVDQLLEDALLDILNIELAGHTSPKDYRLKSFVLRRDLSGNTLSFEPLYRTQYQQTVNTFEKNKYYYHELPQLAFSFIYKGRSGHIYWDKDTEIHIAQHIVYSLLFTMFVLQENPSMVARLNDINCTAADILDALFETSAMYGSPANYGSLFMSVAKSTTDINIKKNLLNSLKENLRLLPNKSMLDKYMGECEKVFQELSKDNARAPIDAFGNRHKEKETKSVAQQTQPKEDLAAIKESLQKQEIQPESSPKPELQQQTLVPPTSQQPRQTMHVKPSANKPPRAPQPTPSAAKPPLPPRPTPSANKPPLPPRPQSPARHSQTTSSSSSSASVTPQETVPAWAKVTFSTRSRRSSSPARSTPQRPQACWLSQEQMRTLPRDPYDNAKETPLQLPLPPLSASSAKHSQATSSSSPLPKSSAAQLPATPTRTMPLQCQLTHTLSTSAAQIVLQRSKTQQPPLLIFMPPKLPPEWLR